MNILIFDNYDSFTYNIVQIVRDLGYTPDIFRNDRITLEEVNRYDKIILSPGPGLPSESGILNELIRTYGPTKSIFGICLGEQAIGEVFGAKLQNLPKVFHGVSTPVHITVSDEYTFAGLPETFSAGRYHSWVVDRKRRRKHHGVAAYQIRRPRGTVPSRKRAHSTGSGDHQKLSESLKSRE